MYCNLDSSGQRGQCTAVVEWSSVVSSFGEFVQQKTTVISTRTCIDLSVKLNLS